jgi:hypothetical protein
MLLQIGSGPNARYLQVVGANGQPRWMDGTGFQRYLHENGKQVLAEYDCKINDPASAQRKMVQLMSQPWKWGGPVHNCGNFAEEIVRAGGGDLNVVLNCPALGVH